MAKEETLLQSLEDLVDQLGRDKMTEYQAIETIHSLSKYYLVQQYKKNKDINQELEYDVIT